MRLKRQPTALKAIGRIAGFKNELKQLGSRMQDVPLWSPAVSLQQQCERALDMVDAISARFERKLVVTLIGPSGSGKSTLLNALVGVDNLSPAGHQRPTTGEVIVAATDPEDARPLVDELGNESVRVRSNPSARIPQHVLLIDTPDTDSRAFEKHVPIVTRAITRSDMLICVFDGENPKRKDHVDFLAPYVRRFDGESLVAVINKCDRLDESELKTKIVPDFMAYIRAAWPDSVDDVLCLCARGHLAEPGWDASAGPRHDFDQYDVLHNMLFDTIDQAGFIVDRRVENARSLRDYVLGEAGRELGQDLPVLQEAAGRLQETEKQAMLSAVESMKNDNSRRLVGVNVMVYQRLSQRWLGPVGWMIAIWARLLIFGAGVVSMFKVGRPVQQIAGMVSALRHFKDTEGVAQESHPDPRLDAGLRSYRLAVMRDWPEIAGRLVLGRFESNVRRVEDALAAQGDLSEKISGFWLQALDAEIERLTRRLSGLVLQLLFNAPGLAILVYTGWLTIRNFLNGTYLAGGFFTHAFWSITIVLLISFFVLQVCIRLAAGTEKIRRNAFKNMQQQMEGLDVFAENPVKTQLEMVIGLARAAGVDLQSD